MNGRANFKGAIAEIRQLEAAFDGLQKKIIQGTNANGGTNTYQQQMAAVHDVRTAMQGHIATLDQYRLRQGQVLSAQDAWQKKIIEGKATFGDMVRNHKMFNSVLRDQLAIQNSVGVGWSQNSKTGKYTVDTIIPKDLPAQLNTLNSRIGMHSQILKSASENMVNWGKNTQWAGRQLMVGFTVPMGIAAAATGKMAYDLDKALNQVVKVYGDATSAFQEDAAGVRNTALETAKAAARIYGQSAEDTLGIMASLAAAGKSGNDLQQATMATTRAAILGELDWQDAVKATISMQEVYGASQQQLADNWNYINAMENQTVLSAQDFVTAIPKVSGVMNELGADLKDTGSLLTAFKAAGIDAAEGANALKSIDFRLVASYGKGLDTFHKATGKDLKEIIAETNGEAIPTMQRFAAAIADLSAPERMAVTRDVFGIYQGSKALMLLEQMTQKTEALTQWQTALNVANNTALENAAIAQQELQRTNDQPFKDIDKAVATLKINLQQLGEAFLAPAAAILGKVGELVNSFNNLSDGTKKFLGIGALIIGLAGPIIMMIGLFANLIANGMKMVATIGMVSTGFKAMTVEERMQQIVSSKLIGTWDAQTSSAAALALMVKELVTSLNAVAPAAANANRAALPAGMAYNKGGKPMYTDDTTHATSVTGRRVKQSDMTAILEQERQAAATEANAAKMQKLANKTIGAAMAVGVLGNMFGFTEGKAGFITELATGVGVLGMMMPSVLGKAFVWVAAKAVWMGNAIAGALNLGSINTGKLMSALKTAGPIIAGVAVAGFAAYSYFNSKVQESIDKVKEFNSYSKDMADVLGYSYTQAGPISKNGVIDGKTAADALATKMRQEKPAMAAGFDDVAKAKDTGQMWGAALAAGVDAKLHGATVEQAENTARVALAIMGQRFDDAEFKVKISGQFDDMDKMIKIKADEWRRTIQSATNPDHAWIEGVFNDREMFQSSIDTATKAGNDFWQAFFNTDDKDKKAMLEKFSQTTDKFLNDAYARAMKNDKAGALKQNGINNAYDFAQHVSELSGSHSNSSITPGFSDDEFTALRQQIGFLQTFAQTAAKAGGVADDQLPHIFKLSDLFQQDRFKALFTPKVIKIDLADKASAKVDMAANAFKYFSAVAGGAVVDTDKFNESLKALGYDAAVTFDQIKTSYQNVYSGAQNTVFDEMARQFEDATQVALDGAQKHSQSLMDALDKKADESAAHFDKLSQQLQDRQDREQKSLKKAQDDRKERETKIYDARVKAIEDAIKAEQKAEDIRQKIFAAEQTRIQRLAQMYSTNIDINTAINTGKMDEAAKLSSNASAQQADWATSDAAGASKSSSEQRVDKLNAEKDAIGKAKDARMKALDEIDAREKESADLRQKNEKRALDDQKDAAKKKIDQEKKTQQQVNADNEKALKRRLDDRKRELDAELATLRAFLPKNETELNTQMIALKGLYNKYGQELDLKSLGWSKTAAQYLLDQTKQQSNRMATEINWSKIGTDIAASMMKGAFGMSPDEFAKWINGGTAPTNSLFGAGASKFVAANKATPRTGSGTPYAGRANDPNRGTWHSGGIVDHSGGSGRTGKSGKYLTPSEVQATLLTGEGVVSRRGMSVLGKAGLDNINSGKRGIGGGGMGYAMGASTGVALGSSMIEATLRGAYRKRMAQSGTFFGNNFGVTPNYAGTALNSITSALSNVVYQSGRVVYLGHNGINGGGDYSGMTRPIPGPVASEFGPRNLFGMSFHNGIDIMAPTGTPIHAAKGGRVVFTGWDNTGYGNYTEIQAADGSMYGYGHQSAINVRAGNSVGTGSVIGLVGSTGNSTGPHLHFQIGNHGNWFNPRQVMPQLDTGGFIQNDGLAKLHKEEVVVTKPLTKKFEQGVNNFAEGGPTQYNVTLDFNGASFDRGIDFQGEVETALRNIERKSGGNRRIGGK